MTYADAPESRPRRSVPFPFPRPASHIQGFVVLVLSRTSVVSAQVRSIHLAFGFVISRPCAWWQTSRLPTSAACSFHEAAK